MSEQERTLHVAYLARVEGEGALTLRFRDDGPDQVELQIFEPPRFFESFLEGRALTEAPDITARICGICPVAYQMSACRAMERGLNLCMPDSVTQLRKVLYAGEWIASHALHIFMLHAPDFLGYPDAMAMAKDHPDLVKDGLFIKKTGNRILALVGGREIHPINVRVGGFYRTPSPEELRGLLPDLDEAAMRMERCLVAFSQFVFPELERPYELVSLRPEGEYPLMGDHLLSNRGVDIGVEAFEDTFFEQQVPHSTALHARRKDGRAYLTGPLARIHFGFNHLHPRAREAAERIGFVPPEMNPYRTLLARGIETLHALASAQDRIQSSATESHDALPIQVEGPFTAIAATEAPRGVLYHRYQVDENGTIRAAKIVPPTSQNQASIEEDLLAMAPKLRTMDTEQATLLAEQTIRNYDPCISCATHFLKLRIEEASP